MNARGNWASKNFKQGLIEKGIKDFNCHYRERIDKWESFKINSVKIIVAKHNRLMETAVKMLQ